ncbi:hypothetical protein HY734_02560 [Candidatus Uhrbacteria bacterium]|nr:hypothetical protein [Candidatus Uhrbacteria bacterium]
MSSGQEAVIGHGSILAYLERAQASGRLPHALLFVGPAQVGKAAVADWLLRRTFGSQGLAHPDVSVVERLTDPKTEKVKEQIVVEQVRELRDRLSHTALFGGAKAALLPEAEALNPEASNALLKTLEEPHPRTLLILCAPAPEAVLPTVASRCLVMRFQPVARATIAASLCTRGTAPELAEEAAGLAQGCPGRAIRFVEDEEERLFETEAVERLCRLIRDPVSRRLAASAEAVPKDDANRAHALARLLERWQGILRDLFLLSLGLPEIAMRPSQVSALVPLAASHPPAHWAYSSAMLRDIRRDLRLHASPSMALEHFFLSL